MAIIPSTYAIGWYDPSQPGGVVTPLNNNANTATSSATQYTMEDVINTVSYTGGSIDGSGAQYALPIFTDTNTITNLPLGSTGQLLTSGGAGVDPSWTTITAGNFTFKGGFNASNGDITSGVNTGAALWGSMPFSPRVEVAVGDLYIAESGSGNFFNDASYPLTSGDAVYAVETVDSDTTVVTDFGGLSKPTGW